MNRQNSVQSEQMLRTESSVRAVDTERMIFLVGSSIFQADRYFVEEFFNFEPQINDDLSQLSSSDENREMETDSMNYHALVHAPDAFTDYKCTCFVLQIRVRL